MLNKLRQKNQELIKQYEQENNQQALMAQKVISQLLKFDDCFMRMSIEHSYALFRELNVKPDMYEKIYLELTKPKN